MSDPKLEVAYICKAIVPSSLLIRVSSRSSTPILLFVESTTDLKNTGLGLVVNRA
ncbi:hypothetical protein KY285_009989 [Solanum tuberosum]|nr:hypothetical protein KY285_009989 [Solanum tuberosum]